MQGIETVAGILEDPAVMALPTTVEPDGDQRQQGQRLPYQEKGLSEKLDLISEAAENFYIDIPKAKKLRHKMPPFKLPRERRR